MGYKENPYMKVCALIFNAYLTNIPIAQQLKILTAQESSSPNS
jgi:hypothetical protein